MQPTLVVGDGDLVLATSALVNSRHVHDAVGVDVECHLDLWDTTWGRWDASQLELSEQVVVLGHGSLSLKDLDQHTRLVVRVGGKGLRLLGWNGGVALDQSRHHTSGRLDTKRQGSHVKKQQVLHFLGLVTVQNGCLDSCSKTTIAFMKSTM